MDIEMSACVRRGSSPHGAGFTFVELLCVLVLLGVVGLLSTRMFTNMIQGYTLARNSDAAVQKAQNAMQRMTIDFTYVSGAHVDGTSTSITYNSPLDNMNPVTISQVDNTIWYNINGSSYILTDGVKPGSLHFNYYDRYDGAAKSTSGNASNMIGFSYVMVGDDTDQGLSQKYSTRVKIYKVH